MHIDSPNPEFSRPMRNDDETSFRAFRIIRIFRVSRRERVVFDKMASIKAVGWRKEIEGDREIGGRKKQGGGFRLPLSHPV